MMNLNLTANILGIISLIASVIAFFPTFISLFKLSFSPTQLVWKIAHFSLMLTVCLGLIHGLLMTQQEYINFYDINTYWVYAGGLFAFNLLVFLSFVFSDLKSDLKKFNYLSYGALFLLACHVGQHILPVF